MRGARRPTQTSLMLQSEFSFLKISCDDGVHVLRARSHGGNKFDGGRQRNSDPIKLGALFGHALFGFVLVRSAASRAMLSAVVSCRIGLRALLRDIRTSHLRTSGRSRLARLGHMSWLLRSVAVGRPANRSHCAYAHCAAPPKLFRPDFRQESAELVGKCCSRSPFRANASWATMANARRNTQWHQ